MNIQKPKTIQKVEGSCTLVIELARKTHEGLPRGFTCFS